MGSTAWARTRPRNSPCRPPTAPPTNATAQVIHLTTWAIFCSLEGSTELPQTIDKHPARDVCGNYSKNIPGRHVPPGADWRQGDRTLSRLQRVERLAGTARLDAQSGAVGSCA